MNKKISILVAYLMRKYKTNDPGVLADYLNVTIIRMPLEDMVAGFYKICLLYTSDAADEL